jgi:hypothetical protein
MQDGNPSWYHGFERIEGVELTAQVPSATTQMHQIARGRGL